MLVSGRWISSILSAAKWLVTVSGQGDAFPLSLPTQQLSRVYPVVYPHMISFTRPSSPLFPSRITVGKGGEEGLGPRLELLIPGRTRERLKLYEWTGDVNNRQLVIPVAAPALRPLWPWPDHFLISYSCK